LSSGFAFLAASQAVIPPGALYLVTDTVDGAAETVKVTLSTLNGTDDIGLGHSTCLDTVFFGDAAKCLDVHGVPYPG
jgi:hypothetical protein